MQNQEHFWLFILLFQHPFIRDAHDPKPVLDLLAEYKAEIVEDEIMDLPEDKEVIEKFLMVSRTTFDGVSFYCNNSDLTLVSV